MFQQWNIPPQKTPFNYPLDSGVTNIKTIQNITSTLTVTNSDQDLQSQQGMGIYVYVPRTTTIQVSVMLGIGATADFEFRPEIRVDGVMVLDHEANAALGSAGDRAMTRGLTASIVLTSGVHLISPGVFLNAGAGYQLAVKAALLNVTLTTEGAFV